MFTDCAFSLIEYLICNYVSKVEIEQLKSKYTLLENESDTTIKKLHCQIKELNLQLKQQSSLNSIIGSTFGYYLWSATQIHAVVDMVLQKVHIYNIITLIHVATPIILLNFEIVNILG